MRSRWLLSFALAPLMAFACNKASIDPGNVDPPDPPDPVEEPAVVYYRDLKPLIDAKCVACHSPGNIAPVDFTVPDVVKSYAALIKTQVEAGLMPPWHADAACNTYSNDRSLSQTQIAKIAEWVDLGAHLGDPLAEGQPLPNTTGGLQRVDLELPTPEPFTPSGTDDYRCFVIEWPEQDIKFVTGFNLIPSNPSVVHHANIYLAEAGGAAEFRNKDTAAAGPGYPCFGGAFGTGVSLLGAWAPGSFGIAFPAGTGIQVDPGAVVVIEMHFNTGPTRSGADQSTFAVSLADRVDRRAVIAPFWNFFEWSQGRMPIPAGEQDVMHAYDFNPDGFLPLIAPWLTNNAIQIWATGMHMHYLATSGTVKVKRRDGSEECVIDIPRWDFNWQNGYLLNEPIPFIIGDDTFYLECHWDNTAANQPVIDGEQRPARDVNWGGRSTDEMCIGYVYITER